MKKFHILVEGLTEQEFVREVLSPYFEGKDIVVTAKVVTTKKVESGTQHKGGGDFKKIKENLTALLQDSSVSLVTMLFDFYGFPIIRSEKERETRAKPSQTPIQRIEQRLKEEITHERFLPFLLLHEFEALLFVNPSISARELEIEEKHLLDIRKVFSPEEINDGPQTAPSKRIQGIFQTLGKTYNKVSDGVFALCSTPIEEMIKECPHFGEWIERIERFCCEDRTRVPDEWFD